MPAASKSACSNGATSWCGGPAVTGSEDMDEWSLVGLTREQGIARWSAVFTCRPPVSRMTMSTSWGWVTWEPADSEAAHVARMAGRVPPPILVEIAVSDPDSTKRRSSHPADSVTTTAWCGLTGLIAGGATGIWFWGMTVATLVLAVAVAAGAVAAGAVWRWLTASIRQPVRILTERDA